MNFDTEDLSKMGYRELAEAGELLLAYAKGTPDSFYDEHVKLNFNPSSGNVFLANNDGQVLMMNGDTLEQFYWLSYQGDEGFIDELYERFKNGSIHEEDMEQLADCLEAEHKIKEAEEVRQKYQELRSNR